MNRNKNKFFEKILKKLNYFEPSIFSSSCFTLFSCLLILCSGFFTLFLFAENNKQPWILEVKEERHAVYYRDSKNSDIGEIKAWALMTGTIDEAIAIIMKTEEYPRIFKNIDITEVLHRDKKCETAYTVLDVPVISNRDYIIRACIVKKTDKYAKIIWEEVEHPDKPPYDKYVRVPVNQGYWEIYKKEEDEIKLVYFVCADAGGMLPKFIQRIANRKAVPDTLFSIYREIKARRNEKEKQN